LYQQCFSNYSSRYKTITASAGANGVLSSSGATVLNCGGSKTYSITPNACYQIATVLVDGVNNAAAVSSGTYTFSSVSAAHTISVTFTSTSITYYADRDGDGFGDAATPLVSCTGAPTFSGHLAVLNNTDCNDLV